LFVIFLTGIHDGNASGFTVQGIVFDDLNKNGIMDRDEQGIPGIVVSNQIEVVRTNMDGKYILPGRDRMIIFVSTPANYRAPLRKDGVPQFYYIHDPKGSPEGLKYPGITPTGDLPATVDFPLFKTEYRPEFNVVVTGDPQMRNEKEVGYFRDDVLPRMFSRDAAFYLSLGDQAADNLSVYPSYLEALSQLQIPVYNVLGNHDENYDVPEDASANETFRKTFGPEYYSFNYGQVHFIILDVVEYRGWNKGKNSQGSYRGYLTDEQLAWLENDLKFVTDDQLIALAMHIPLFTNLEPESDGVNVVNRDHVFRLLEKRRYLLALSGHLHIIENFFLSPQSGWNGTNPFYSLNAGAACGSWWSGPNDIRGIPVSLCMDGSPNGFFIFTFKENAFDYKFIPAKQDESLQMRISSPAGSIAAEKADSLYAIANIFCADPQSQVYFQLDREERQLMQNKRMKDPFMVEYMNEYKAQHPSWLQSSVDTDHIWVAQLPSNLSAGVHVIRISAVDSRGKSYSGIQLFKLMEAK